MKNLAAYSDSKAWDVPQINYKNCYKKIVEN